jgi:uncharacterized protein YndB with AHSA1/START domain
MQLKGCLMQIQRSVVIRAPRSRVWKGFAEIGLFGQWFSAEPVDPNASFQPGAYVRLRSTYPGPYKGMEFAVEIVDVKPEECFSWRWQPGVKLPGEDLSSEPKTLVEFRLEEAEDGTRVTVTETGFDQLLASRRDRVYGENESGWKTQMAALERYFGDAN